MSVPGFEPGLLGENVVALPLPLPQGLGNLKTSLKMVFHLLPHELIQRSTKWERAFLKKLFFSFPGKPWDKFHLELQLLQDSLKQARLDRRYL